VREDYRILRRGRARSGATLQTPTLGKACFMIRNISAAAVSSIWIDWLIFPGITLPVDP
jgi:hypothetical protein